jgi:hypothetical protein
VRKSPIRRELRKNANRVFAARLENRKPICAIATFSSTGFTAQLKHWQASRFRFAREYAVERCDFAFMQHEFAGSGIVDDVFGTRSLWNRK